MSVSKSSLYTANIVPTNVDTKDLIPLGNTIRRFGNSVALDGNVIDICGRCEYFLVNAVVNVTALSSAPISVTLNQDGAAVIGATSTAQIKQGDKASIPISAIVRNRCECGSALSFVAVTDEVVTVDSIAVTVVKL